MIVEPVAPALLSSYINNATGTSPSSKQQGVASMGMQIHSTLPDPLLHFITNCASFPILSPYQYRTLDTLLARGLHVVDCFHICK
jgi:hypothetical protein